MPGDAVRRIGVLTSGGDAPGMNAALRAVVRTGCALGVEVIGIERGWHGLIHGQFRDMDARSVSGIIYLGGTALYTARSDEFLTREGRARAAESMRRIGMDGIVAIGGDGTYRGAVALMEEHGARIIGVPGTIDNDIPGTGHTIGFDTAVNTALESIDRIRDTTEAHEKVSIVEVMGREAGFIAIEAGLAGGAEAVLIPEQPVDFERLCQDVRRWQAIGKKSSIIVVAEGAASGHTVARRVEEATGLTARLTVLGYIQRGGRPTARDRVLATRFGYHATRLLCEGRSGLMVGLDEGDTVVTNPLRMVLDGRRQVQQELLDLVAVTAACAGGRGSRRATAAGA